MPKSNIQTVCDVVGEEATMLLARSLPLYNGRRCLYVPSRWENAAWLVSIIGTDNARRLHDAMAGCQIRIGDISLYERKKAAMQMLSIQGINVAECARKTGLHRSTIYRNWMIKA